jgi:hypothetical protein
MTFGGADLTLSDPSPVSGQGCLDFVYSFKAANSTLVFLDAAGNYWVMGSPDPATTVGTFHGSAYVPTSNSWGATVQFIGKARDSTSTRTINITLSGSFVGSQSCQGGVPVTDGALTLSGSGLVS